MKLADNIIHVLTENHAVIVLQTKGLTHEDSLLQLPFRGNCLNWVLGHIVQNRNDMLKLLEADPIWQPNEEAPYAPGSRPITNPQVPHLPLETIMQAFQQTQRHIIQRLHEIEPDELEHINGKPAGGMGRLEALLWHETYHVGQTEYLRQLAGTNDSIL